MKMMNKLGIPVLDAAILLILASGMMGLAGELCAWPDLSRSAILIALADAASVMAFVVLADACIFIDQRRYPNGTPDPDGSGAVVSWT